MKPINFFKHIESKTGRKVPLRVKFILGEPLLPEDLKVEGDLDLSGTKIASLPEGLKVGGSLNLSRTNITSLPEGLKVGGILKLYGTRLTGLVPKDIKCGGTIKVETVKQGKLFPKRYYNQILVGRIPLLRVITFEKLKTHTISIGKKTRTERGEILSYEEFKTKVRPYQLKHLEMLHRDFGIVWGKVLYYSVLRLEGEGKGFAVLGKDGEGREFMYDRRETENPAAGQTKLHSKYGQIQVSSIYDLPKSSVLRNLNLN